MYAKTSIWDDINMWYQHGGSTVRLIMLNTILFLISGVMGVLDFLLGIKLTASLQYFYLPASFSKLIWQIWSLGSYMFLHSGFFHYFFNMIGLYVFGNLLSDFIPRRSIVPLYLLGGLAGGLFYLLAYHSFPVFHAAINESYLTGASAAVMALLGTLAALQPNFSVPLILFGQVRIKYIALFYVIADLLMIKEGNAGGHLAHLGGMLFGVVYAQQAWYTYNFNNWFYSLKNLFIKPKQPRIVYRRPVTEKVTTTTAPTKTNKTIAKRTRQEKVDAILDKIAHSGYDSLSKEEKEFLFKISQDTDNMQ